MNKFFLFICGNLLMSTLSAMGSDKNLQELSKLKGKVTSPYEACKEKVIVSKIAYEQNKEDWDKFEKTCESKLQFAEEAGLTSIDPLKEGVQYLDFSQRVAKKVVQNLEKSMSYADCTALCFTGAKTCKEGEKGKKEISCSARKDEVIQNKKVNARKIRMELALSNDAPGARRVNVQTALNADKSQYINSDMRSFESFTPNPLGKFPLTERERK